MTVGKVTENASWRLTGDVPSSFEFHDGLLGAIEKHGVLVKDNAAPHYVVDVALNFIPPETYATDQDDVTIGLDATYTVSRSGDDSRVFQKTIRTERSSKQIDTSAEASTKVVKWEIGGWKGKDTRPELIGTIIARDSIVQFLTEFDQWIATNK
jgi:hypothetical protein